MATKLRGYGWLALVVAAGAGFVFATQAWWQVPYGVGAGSGAVPISGGEGAAGLPQAVTAVLAAGVLLSLTVRGWGRLVVAGLLAVGSLAMLLIGIMAPVPGPEVTDPIVQQTTFEPTGEIVRAWAGPAYAAAGLVGLVGAGLLLAAGRQAPRSVDRFDRTATTAQVSADDDPLTVWRALDEGLDPTEADEPAQAGPHDQARPNDDAEISPISPQRPDVMRMGSDGNDPDVDAASDEHTGRHS